MPEPTKIPRPFADSGDKNAIPDSSGSIGFASWQEGFPAITSEPFASGGVAPKRADFNGIFNALSLATVWQQKGGFYAYDNTTDYEVGNVVEYSGDLYKCLAANGPSSAVKAPTDASIWGKITTADDVNTIINTYLPGAVTALTSGDKSAPNNTVTNLLDFTLSPGNYIVVATASFGEITSGYIQLGIGLSASSANMDRYSVVRAVPSSSYGSALQLVRVMSVTATTAYYLNTRQNSGTSQQVTAIGLVYKQIL